MKKTLLLLSLAGCIALPTITRADSPSTKNAKITRTTATAPAKPSSNKVIYYITQETRTGSNIPTVYRRYNGRIDSASSPAVYGQDAINATGQLDVGAVLNRLDPGVSVRGHR